MAQAQCDLRCQYANPADDAECKCVCGGKNHGKGQNKAKWDAKQERHLKTRRAFRAHLNSEKPRSGNRLYRRHRQEFEKQYAIWREGHGGKPQEQKQEEQKEHGVESKVEEVKTVHQSGSDVTVIKDAKVGNDVYSHVRRSNGKTEYRKNDKVCTKADVPAELGW